MRILYKPFAIIAGFISARIGRNVFAGLWSRIDDDEPPGPTAPEATCQKCGCRRAESRDDGRCSAAVERASARTFHHLTGYWPAEKKDKKEKKDKD